MDTKTVAYDLAKKYAFEKFNFKDGTPEELLALFQDTESAISAVLGQQKHKQDQETASNYLKSGIKTVTI